MQSKILKIKLNTENKNPVYAVKLAWYTREIEKMTVQDFLETIANKINKKYEFTLHA